MDPGGNEATINVGGEWGPGPPGEGEDEQLVPSSGDVHRMPEDICRRQARHDVKISSCTEYISSYVLIHCNLKDCNHE